ncbi:MAG TPA: FAD-dependent monooxygenase [Candidatus Saccharimonadales bacterium]|nr:FAD-dependent monooxygenase [Candidatus Saccharimonadales bacterium]
MARLDAQVAVVGAGPIGMTLAGRLAQHGVSVILLEQHPGHQGEGSKALCMQRETLEIWARLGIGEQVARRGVQWSVGRTYYRGRELFQVRLPAQQGDHFPPFVNISQTEVEELLLTRLGEVAGVEQRWGHRLVGLVQDAESVTLRCETPIGETKLRVAYAVGTDGAHSGVRSVLGAGFPGHSHRDLFLICDIRAQLAFPNERRFHFDPPWNPGRQVLIHPQPDDTWRIDWQVPAETDAEAERANGGLDRRIRQVIGPGTDYELLWLTAYRFQQRVADRFRVGRVFLAGDAAHVVSPFGARGLNSGVADAENLAWKMALVLDGRAPDALLESYQTERRAAAVENEAVTDATMRFMVPHGPLRRLQRNAILRGSLRLRQLRRLVNSGRLAQPFVYADSPIIARSKPDQRVPTVGAAMPDAACSVLGRTPRVPGRIARVRDLFGDQFVALLVVNGEKQAASAAVRAMRLAWAAPCRVALVGASRPLAGVTVLSDPSGELRRSFGGAGSYAFLVRPDGHLAASLPLPSVEAVDALAGLQARAIGA